MIQVYFDSVGPKKALQVYTDGRLSRLVDFGYLPDGSTPDPAATHSSIVKRFMAGEAIQNNAYPNDAFPAPEIIRPKRFCKDAILRIEMCPPYYIGRGIEEAITIQPQAQKDLLFAKVKQIFSLKADLRGIVAADPAAWAEGQREALQARIDEVIGWAN